MTRLRVEKRNGFWQVRDYETAHIVYAVAQRPQPEVWPSYPWRAAMMFAIVHTRQEPPC